jgi:molecular chaperone GrpE
LSIQDESTPRSGEPPQNDVISSPPGDAQDSPENLAAAAEEVAAQLAKVQAERDELRNSLLRLQADFDNFRRRMSRDRQEEAAKQKASILESLLPVIDAFERAFAEDADPAHAESRRGFQLIYRQILETLGRMGLQRIAARGELFDPQLHQAAERVENSDVPDGTILEELHSGYVFQGRVLRPSMVRVAVTPSAETTELPAANES